MAQPNGKLVSASDLKIGDTVKLSIFPSQITAINPESDSDRLIITVYADYYKRYTQDYLLDKWQLVERIGA